jgi:methionyl-tRNA synthetase
MLAAAARPGPLVITATAPTPNGPLHLGHLSGPYVAADIAARAARADGTPVLTLSGVDPHQNYVPAKARLEGRDPAVVLDDYGAAIRQALAGARVRYDIFTDPRTDAGYRQAVTALLDELLARKAAVIEEVKLARCGRCAVTLHHAYVTGTCPVCGADSGGGTCEGCGAFTTAASLRTPRCATCDRAPEPFLAEIPVLRLEAYREELALTWATAAIPPRVRALIQHYLDDGLPDVPLAYPTDWGIGWSDDQRVDVWAEMGLGLLVAVGRQVAPDAAGLADYAAACGQAGQWWHFLGLDNAFYFAMLFPALFAAASAAPDWLGGLVVNEFYRLDGAKFSTSRRHAIWAHEFLAGEDPALVRLFLCWDRPDRSESSFSREAYTAFCDWIGPILSDGPEQGILPEPLVEAELDRARAALDPASFDPGLALRALLAAGPGRDAGLLAALTGA